MLQATVCDCVTLDALPFREDRLGPAEVDIGWCEVVDALMITDVIVVFDEGPYLAFEVTGDFERDARQVRIYAERHGVEYPLLVAGLSDKDEASRAFPVLDRVRSYPTTIFTDRDGGVRAIHTGFSGPATGAAQRHVHTRVDRLALDIPALLAEHGQHLRVLAAQWNDESTAFGELFDQRGGHHGCACG